MRLDLSGFRQWLSLRFWNEINRKDTVIMIDEYICDGTFLCSAIGRPIWLHFVNVIIFSLRSSVGFVC